MVNQQGVRMSTESDLYRLEQVIREKYPDEFARGDAAHSETAAYVASRLLERKQEEATPFGEDYSEQIKVGLIGMLGGVLLAAVIAGGLWFATARPANAASVQPDSEYYRGVYDICMYIYGEVDTCLTFSASTAERDWYGQQSPGWQWPVPAAEAAVSNTD
jgi:hypothetical protein